MGGGAVWGTVSKEGGHEGGLGGGEDRVYKRC